jgi:hypothetical protein
LDLECLLILVHHLCLEYLVVQLDLDILEYPLNLEYLVYLVFHDLEHLVYLEYLELLDLLNQIVEVLLILVFLVVLDLLNQTVEVLLILVIRSPLNPDHLQFLDIPELPECLVVQ